ncbi:hypothetical protein ACS0TY_015789 [Phlomoides rotata]
MGPNGFNKKGFVRINVLLWADILVSYALFVMQDYLTDVWKLDFTHAAGILNIWGGISKVLPVFFLFFVEALLGNFKLLVVTSISYSVGISLLAMSVPPMLANATGTCSRYEPECIGQTQKVLFYTGMALIAIGGAGNLVSEKPFCDAQEDVEHTPMVGLLRIPGFIIVALVPVIGAIALPYIKPWTARFGIPAICTVIATLVFMTGWCGQSKYTKDEPKLEGSPITNVCRVYVAAASKMCVSFPLNAKKYHKNNENDRLRPTRFLRCLERAAIIPDGLDPKENKWRICSVTDVEEAKIAVRMVPMWMTFVVCGIVSSIANTYFVEQAKNMNRYVGKLKLPPQILLLIFNYSKGGFRFLAACVLQKVKRDKGEELQAYKKRATAERSTYMKVAPAIGIGLGMAFSVLCCIIAAVIEKRRLGVIRSHGLLDKPDEEIPMNMLWLVFQFVLLAGLDSFLENSVSEFYTHQSPESMKDYLDYFTMGVSGLGFIFSVLCVYVVGKISEKGGKPSWFQDTLNKSRLDRYYWVLAGLSTVNLFVFAFVAYFYRYEARNEGNSSSGGGGEDGVGNLELGTWKEVVTENTTL